MSSKPQIILSLSTACSIIFLVYFPSSVNESRHFESSSKQDSTLALELINMHNTEVKKYNRPFYPIPYYLISSGNPPDRVRQFKEYVDYQTGRVTYKRMEGNTGIEDVQTGDDNFNIWVSDLIT